MAYCPDFDGLKVLDTLVSGGEIPGMPLDQSTRKALLDHIFVQVGKRTAAANFDLSPEARQSAQTDLLQLLDKEPEMNELAFWARRQVAEPLLQDAIHGDVAS